MGITKAKGNVGSGVQSAKKLAANARRFATPANRGKIRARYPMEHPRALTNGEVAWVLVAGARTIGRPSRAPSANITKAKGNVGSGVQSAKKLAANARFLRVHL